MKIEPGPVITLLHQADHGTLATNSLLMPGYPYATVVPYVLDETHAPVVCISALAEHTKNVMTDARMSFSVRQPGTADVQSAARLTLIGDARRFEPSADLRARYLRYEPNAEEHLMLDFMFFRLHPKRIRFIGGVGKMGWLDGLEWDALPRLSGEAETSFIREATMRLGSRVKLLGADCFGIDYEIDGRRKRQRFPDAPLSAEEFADAGLRLESGLS